MNVSIIVDRCNTVQSWSFKESLASLIIGVIKKQTSISTKLINEMYLNKFWFELIIKIMKEAKEISAIIIKNLGQIYLKKTLASSALTSLLRAGATSADWNKVIPTIIAENTNGRFFIFVIN